MAGLGALAHRGVARKRKKADRQNRSADIMVGHAGRP